MKKLFGVVLALIFAVTAAAQNYASEKIKQIVEEGKLEQTVFAGDNIEQIKILYENTGFGEYGELEYSSTDFSGNFGLTKIWTKGPACIISGKMRGDIVAGTYKAFIIVKDKEGNLAKTEFTFIVKEKPFSLEWNASGGQLNQSVKAGDAIDTIVFNYEGIKSWGVSGLPSGLTKVIDEKNHKIIIADTVNKNVMSGDYEYKVIVENDVGGVISKSGTISVSGGEAKADIEVYENKNQKVVAGDEIKPVVFQFVNVRVDKNLSSFKTDEGSLKGKFKYSVEGDKLTVSGTVDENMQDGSYSIKIIVKGENNCDTAFASVEVTHKPVVTKVTILENASQKVTAGDSIKPIVFYRENALKTEMSNFPGGYQPITNGDTVTIIGLIQEGSRGLHDFVFSVFGPDNQASAKATIEVIPATMTFDLVEGSENQTVVAGQDIVPIVYQYSHMYSVKGNVPANLKVEQNKEKKQVKIFGAVDSKSANHEYSYTFELTDYYENTKTVTGKINVVASNDDISSSSKVSSSSSSVASSSANSSSSIASSSTVSSSSAKPTSSSVQVSSSSATPSSSSVKSSSSVAQSSSSIKTSSSSAKSSSSIASSSAVSSSSAKPASSSAQASSSSAKPSSSSAKSSSSVDSTSSSSVQNDKTSSSSKAKSSSSKAKSSSSKNDKDAIVTVAMSPIQFSYANNELTVAIPTSTMVRMQVFDLTGHLVKTFAESVSGSKSFSLAHLNRGSYIVRLESQSLARTAKVTVK